MYDRTLIMKESSIIMAISQVNLYLKFLFLLFLNCLNCFTWCLKWIRPIRVLCTGIHWCRSINHFVCVGQDLIQRSVTNGKLMKLKRIRVMWSLLRMPVTGLATQFWTYCKRFIRETGELHFISIFSREIIRTWT